MQKILIIDNRDSFVRNVEQFLREGGADVEVVGVDVLDFMALGAYAGAVISPGPGLPSDYLQLSKFIGIFRNPILGICLGHQAIAEYFGARLEKYPPRHGHVSKLKILKNCELFDGLDSENIFVGRYHSWRVSHENFPEELEITSEADDGAIMSVRHAQRKIFAVQFHPESVMTPLGGAILNNFLKIIRFERA